MLKYDVQIGSRSHLMCLLGRSKFERTTLLGQQSAISRYQSEIARVNVSEQH